MPSREGKIAFDWILQQVGLSFLQKFILSTQQGSIHGKNKEQARRYQPVWKMPSRLLLQLFRVWNWWTRRPARLWKSIMEDRTRKCFILYLPKRLVHHDPQSVQFLNAGQQMRHLRTSALYVSRTQHGILRIHRWRLWFHRALQELWRTFDLYQGKHEL